MIPDDIDEILNEDPPSYIWVSRKQKEYIIRKLEESKRFRDHHPKH